MTTRLRGSKLRATTCAALLALCGMIPAAIHAETGLGDDVGTIIVTGTRLESAVDDTPLALTMIDASDLTGRGNLALGDMLNDLPQLRSTWSQGNSTRSTGTAGLNLLDLRGQGVSRTLVLVNGRRQVSGVPGENLIDVNTIPAALLERVDVITGGNSAVYGSDAVAGVVNFVLRRDFAGLSFKGQSGISSRGDRRTGLLSATWGRNFADGRGNLALAVEYAHQAELRYTQRDGLTGAWSGRCQLQTVEPTGGEVNGSDGIFDQAYLCGIASGAFSDGGTIGRIGVGRFLRFNDGGKLFVDSAAQQFEAGGSSNLIGSSASTLRNTGQLLPKNARLVANLLAHFDVSDGFRPFVEARYARISANQEGQPTFFPSATYTPLMRCDNGFITAANRTVLRGYGLCASTALPLPFSRSNTDLGARGEVHTRETMRLVGGVEGRFNGDWKYEIALNYSKLETRMRATNVARIRNDAGTAPDGMALALDAVLAPANYAGSNFVLNGDGRKVICRVNAAAITRPDCVPLNLFGSGQASAGALAFISGTATRRESASQWNAIASISGDSSQVFTLPGGPMAFALGGEYRRETARSTYDAASRNGAFFFGKFLPFAPPRLSLREAFGEISLPLARRLTVSAAARISDYSSAAGTVWAWNVQGSYAPIDDIRLRAAYAASVRAPTLGDLHAAAAQNFGAFSDPCDALNITSGPYRAANCAAAGVPTTFNAAAVAACAGSAMPATARELGDPWGNCTARSSAIGYISGGNPTLKAERGKSLTLGVVIEPRFLPGLNLTVDAYRITISGLIANLAAQQIISLCYDSPSGINNPFCATVNRNAATGLFAAPAVIAGGVNFAAQKTRGVDADLSYRRAFANGHRLSLRALATLVQRLDTFTNPADPRIPNRVLGELGDPRFAANLDAAYDFGRLKLSYGLRYIGKQAIGSWEAQHRYQGLCPASGSTGLSGGTCTPGSIATLDPQNADLNPYVVYPAALYHNARADFRLHDGGAGFYVGVDNLLDRQPPYGLIGAGGGEPYDTIGRYFYAGFRIDL